MYASDVVDAIINNCCAPTRYVDYEALMRRERYACSCALIFINTVTVTSGGSGFAVGDFVQLSTGTPENGQPPALFRVKTINSSGSILAILPVLVPAYARFSSTVIQPNQSVTLVNQNLAHVTGSGVGAQVSITVSLQP